ncbi:hypothetical protein BT63DRAFT_412377 [Microthyrium microscopicum]|uniref:DUF7029 domain-containing protein n=1 Tax=Microthyrium microscopicum TaxID=703497 RepID=A0A6A6UGC4_9PEZI|nr:hypothetical protein BT63DRAFT_412377 [Microthyrium microscopicum]
MYLQLVILWFLSSISFVTAAIHASEESGLYTLHAATRRHLSERATAISLTTHAELHFMDNRYDVSTHSTAPTMAVRLQNKKPFLLLEDYDHLLRSIDCVSSSHLEIEIGDEKISEESLATWSNVVGSYMITSHSGCGTDGERVVYSVRSITSPREGALLFEVDEARWSETSFEFSFKYEQSTAQHQILHPSRLAKRGQFSGSAITPSPANASQVQSVSGNLSFSAVNKTLDLSNLGPVALPITVGCVRCETTGLITLTDSNIQPPNLNITNLRNNGSFADIFGSGKAILQANNVTAHIELSISPQLGTQSFTYTLIAAPPSPVGFQIPNFGALGLTSSLDLVFSVTVAANVTFTAGFDLTVPSGSQIAIDLAHPERSSVIGFANTTLKALPFQANVDNLNLTTSLTIKPNIQVGILLLDGKINATADAALELPTLSTTITPLSADTVDINCNAANNTKKAITNQSSTNQNTTNEMIEDSTDSTFLSQFPNLLNLVPRVSFAVDLSAQAKLAIPGLGPVQTQKKIYQIASGLPTACLAFDKQAESGREYVPASTALAQVKAAESKAAASSASASSSSAAAAAAKATGGAAKKSMAAGSRPGMWMIGRVVMPLALAWAV